MDSKNYPLVSVVIPMHNAERFIGECIDSVINQEYSNWEVLVVDNCSTDKSRDIVLAYAKENPKIRLITSESNSGSPARPRNIGIRNAKGKYIALLDADDIWLKEKLSQQVAFLEQDENTFLLYSRYSIWKNGRILDKIAPAVNRMKSGKIFNSLFLSENFIACTTVMLRNRYECNYLFDENPHSMEDLDLWLRISKNEAVSFINKSLVIYRVHEKNTTTNIAVFCSKYLVLLKKWRKETAPLIMGAKYIALFFLLTYMVLRRAKDSIKTSLKVK